VFIFLVLGIFVLLLRRDKRDIFMLAWLFSLYLILHRDVFGSTTFLHRSLSATAHIIMPLIVIGALSIVSFIKMPRSYKTLTNYGVAALIVALVLIYNAPPVRSTLEAAYDSPFSRLNTAQIEVSEWIKDNSHEQQNVSLVGPPSELIRKLGWMASYSHRRTLFYESFMTGDAYEKNREELLQGHLQNDLFVFDYSDIGLLGDRRLVDQWLLFEQQNFANRTLLYNKNNIRVYKNADS